MSPAPEALRRVKVWNGGLRLAHWSIALTVLTLIGSGWLLGQELSPDLHFRISRLHELTGYLLTIALVFRLYAFFWGTGSDLWKDFLPRGPQWNAVRETFIFYMSFARTPLPSWYAHNPLWGPLYLLLFVLLGTEIVTGLLFHAQLTSAALHYAAYTAIALFSLLHVATVFLHDWRGTASEISAMISGYKIFVLRRPINRPPLGFKGIKAKKR